MKQVAEQWTSSLQQETAMIPDDTAVPVGVNEENTSQVEKFHSSSEIRLLKVNPNPVVDQGTIKFKNPLHEEHVLYVLDNLGNVVRKIDRIIKESIVIERGNLRSGLYFLQLFKKDSRIAIAKMIIQ